MAYTLNGNEYTFLAKDELERPLPVLKKAYLNYSDVAGKTVQYMFYDLFKNYLELKAETLGSCCFINDGKGNFTKMELPGELQLAPVFSFTNTIINGTNSFIAGGNFYGVIPYEGRYDALQPTIFSFDGKTKKFIINSCFNEVEGEVRDIKWLKDLQNKKIAVFARNNSPLIFYQQKEQ
jgi:hypothetical protein